MSLFGPELPPAPLLFNTKRITYQPVAQKCPVCLGRCTMPSTFYEPPNGTSAPKVDVPCKSCLGKGIVWPPSEPADS